MPAFFDCQYFFVLLSILVNWNVIVNGIIHDGSPKVRILRQCRLKPLESKAPLKASGDFIEISGSLLNLLNLAQEVETSTNTRFRLAADRLKDQFVRSFAVRYDLSSTQFLSAALAYLDGDDNSLSEEQLHLRDTVLYQLQGIEKTASSILFFNEPLSNLEEFKSFFTFPSDTMDISPFDETGFSHNAISRSYEQSNHTSETEELIMVKKGLQQEMSKWRADLISKLKATLGIERTDKSIDNDAKLIDESNTTSAVSGSTVMAPPAILVDPFIDDGYLMPFTEGVKQAASNKIATNSTTTTAVWFRLAVPTETAKHSGLSGAQRQPSQADIQWKREQEERARTIQHLRKATSGRWRASMELIDSAKNFQYDKVMKRPVGSQSKKQNKNNDNMDNPRVNDNKDSLRVNKANPAVQMSAMLRLTGTSSSAASLHAPNYALLVHSSLLMCLATYNLELNATDWLDINTTEVVDKVKNAMTKATSDVFSTPAVTLINSVLLNSTLGPLIAQQAAALNFNLNFNNTISSRSDDTLQKENDLRRVQMLAYNAIGGRTTTTRSHRALHSDKACGVVVHEPKLQLAIIAFRGTRDPIDVLTDITFFSTEFQHRQATARTVAEALKAAAKQEEEEQIEWEKEFVEGKESSKTSGDGTSRNEDEKMEVHMGFYAAFDSLRSQLDDVINNLPDGTKVLLVGHSMGGALAQIAAAYYSDLQPWLVTFGAPSIGNKAFCDFINKKVLPHGGLRIWNEYDAIPYIAMLVGYQHAGVPIKSRLKKSAKDLFQNESINAIAAALELVSPHILYQVGSLIHVFPVMGADVGPKATVEGDLMVNGTANIPRYVIDLPYGVSNTHDHHEEKSSYLLENSLKGKRESVEQEAVDSEEAPDITYSSIVQPSNRDTNEFVGTASMPSSRRIPKQASSLIRDALAAAMPTILPVTDHGTTKSSVPLTSDKTFPFNSNSMQGTVPTASSLTLLSKGFNNNIKSIKDIKTYIPPLPPSPLGRHLDPPANASSAIANTTTLITDNSTSPAALPNTTQSIPSPRARSTDVNWLLVPARPRSKPRNVSPPSEVFLTANGEPKVFLPVFSPLEGDDGENAFLDDPYFTGDELLVAPVYYDRFKSEKSALADVLTSYADHPLSSSKITDDDDENDDDEEEESYRDYRHLLFSEDMNAGGRASITADAPMLNKNEKIATLTNAVPLEASLDPALNQLIREIESETFRNESTSSLDDLEPTIVQLTAVQRNVSREVEEETQELLASSQREIRNRWVPLRPVLSAIMGKLWRSVRGGVGASYVGTDGEAEKDIMGKIEGVDAIGEEGDQLVFLSERFDDSTR